MIVALAACVAVIVIVALRHRNNSDDAAQDPSKQTLTESAPARPSPPHRTALGDQDLREMLAGIISSKACDLIADSYRPLRAPDRPGVVTGFLHIDTCKITAHGTQVTFALAGQGWQWAAQETKKAGGTFALHQYVRFSVEASIPGAIDLGYDPDTHVASIWFTPKATPDVHFKPLGDLRVDEKGAWSEIIGAVSSVFGSSPSKQAHGQAEQQGVQQFQEQFSKGLAVTIDLCDGVMRFNLGAPPTGKMIFKDTGETPRVPVELQPDGLAMFGPEPPGKGVTVHLHSDGPVHAALLCQTPASGLARSYASRGLAVELPALAARDLDRGDATLHVAHPGCPVIVAVSSRARTPVTFDWLRPAREKAAGPLVHCK